MSKGQQQQSQQQSIGEMQHAMNAAKGPGPSAEQVSSGDGLTGGASPGSAVYGFEGVSIGEGMKTKIDCLGGVSMDGILPQGGAFSENPFKVCDTAGAAFVGLPKGIPELTFEQANLNHLAVTHQTEAGLQGKTGIFSDNGGRE